MTAVLDTTGCQQAQLLAADLSPDPLAGVVGRTIRLGVGCRYSDVQGAWTSLLRAHPGLRVRFRQRGGHITQELRDYDHLPDVAKTVLVTGPRVNIARASIQPYGPVLLRAYFTEATGELTLLVHHALVDEHALGLLLDFLVCAIHEPVAVRAVPTADYAATVNALIAASQDRRSTSGEFWARQLAEGGSSRAPVWPTGTATPGGRWQTQLDGPTVQALRASARAASVSVPMLVHAAVAVLLHRYGLGERPVIGVPVSLRDHPAVGFDAVGLYLTALPVATEVRGEDDLDTVLGRVRTALIQMHEHKFLPPMDMPGFAELTATDRGGSQFGVTLAVRQLAAESPLAVVRPLPMGGPAASLHLDLELAPDSGQLTLMWRVGVTPWPAPEAIASHLVRILNTFAVEPGRTVGGFALEAEHCAAPTELSVGDLVPHLVREMCTVRATQVAVSDPASTWTYAQLARAVGQVRAALRARDLPAGARIGVACGRSRWQIAAILALWQDGLCYVPLNPNGPAERNQMIIDDAGLAAVIGTDPRLPTLLALDTIQRCEPTTCTPTRNASTDPAYMMYTSGTSGRPKGVVLTHGNLASFTAAMADTLPITGTGRWLAETDATFDISLVELVLPLAWGQSIIVADPTDHATVDDDRFDFRQCTPSRARQILTARELGEPLGRWHVQPGVWLVGGEALPAPLLRELRAAYPSTLFVNMYGPTEATIWATCHVCTDEHPADVPLGTALPNASLAVRDRYGWPAPAGVPGELLIGGHAVAAGYLHRPELTAQRFADVDGTRMYRSGDLVQLGPDHGLYFRGRVDDQIKIRGHRIELAEVEAHLLAHNAVAEAVVFAVAEDLESVRLAAVVVPRDGHRLDSDKLGTALAARLPHAVIPTITVVDALPRLPSGKTDRGIARQLADAQQADPAADSDPQAAVIAEAMSRVVGRSVRVDDDFFRVGGNSLNALRVVALLRERSIQVRPLELFERRTPRRIAADAIGANTAAAVLESAASWPPIGIDELWQHSVDPWDHRAPSPLVPLAAEGHGHPLFCVHWGVGTIRFVADVADDCRAGHPLYGLEMAGYRGNVRPLLSIAEMAERYMAEIRAVQPSGLYHLVGLRQGGIVAVEIARMLRAAGQNVAPLVLVGLPSHTPPYYDPGWGIDQIYADGWENLRTRFGVDGPGDLARAMTEMIEIGWYEPGEDPNDLYRLEALWAAGMFAQDHHEPAPYDGPAVLVQNSASTDRIRAVWGSVLTNSKLVVGEWESVLEILRDQRFATVIREILTMKVGLR